jgi:hypothetical protein
MCCGSKRLFGNRRGCLAHEKIFVELHKVYSVVDGLFYLLTKVSCATLSRFQMVVISAYKQIRSTDLDILNDIDEDNYDRAFAAFRPGAVLLNM